jgi:hypothetical protein
MVQLRKAERTQAKLKIGLTGPSGSGKTMSALLLASGLTTWDKIAIIDTENGSADLYSNLGDYNVVPLATRDENGKPIQAPYSPERYIEAILACEEAGMEVIIIDSISHAWAGQGGALEQQEKLGGRYQDWAKVKPRVKRLIDAVLQSPAHVIVNARTKTDYAMDSVDGRTKITKMGTKVVFEEGLDYELTLVFDIAISHLANASKDRTGIFMDKQEKVIEPEHGKRLLTWASSGKAPLPKAKPEVTESPTTGDTTPKATNTAPAPKKAMGTETLTEEIKAATEKEINALVDVEAARKLYARIYNRYVETPEKVELLKKVHEAVTEIQAANNPEVAPTAEAAAESSDKAADPIDPPVTTVQNGEATTQESLLPAAAVSPEATPNDTPAPKAKPKGRPKKVTPAAA